MVGSINYSSQTDPSQGARRLTAPLFAVSPCPPRFTWHQNKFLNISSKDVMIHGFKLKTRPKTFIPGRFGMAARLSKFFTSHINFEQATEAPKTEWSDNTRRFDIFISSNC